MATLVLIDAIQAEVLNKAYGAVSVISAYNETLIGFEPKDVQTTGLQINVVYNTPPGFVRFHASQVEVVYNKAPGPVNIHAGQVDVLYLNDRKPDAAQIASMSIEVLRSIGGKRRRGMQMVSAN